MIYLKFTHDDRKRRQLFQVPKANHDTKFLLHREELVKHILIAVVLRRRDEPTTIRIKVPKVKLAISENPIKLFV